MALTYELADVALKAGIARLDELGLGLSIAVVDELGQPVAVGRMSTARRGTTSLSAQRKAMVSINGGPRNEITGHQDGGALSAAAAEQGKRPTSFAEGSSRGALPLEEDGRFLGVIAAGGGIGVDPDAEAVTAGAAAFEEALAAGGSARAPARPVDSLYGTHGSISFEAADRILKAAMTKAEQMGLAVSIAVLDEGTHPVAVGRMTGASEGTTSLICQGKAAVAAVWGVESRATSDRIGGTGGGIGRHAQELYGNRLVFEPGGVALREGSRVIGAVGVAGSTTPEKDEEIAAAAAAALESLPAK